MEAARLIADAVLFPSAAYYAETSILAPIVDDNSDSVPWQLSSLNPANRINTLDPVLSPKWEIDGADYDGAHLWATPSFARGRAPRRIDVYYRDADLETPGLRMLRPSKLPIVSSGARSRLGISRHILRGLEYWSARVPAFEQKYMALPFGSQIAIDELGSDVRSMSISMVPDYDLERQWLPADDLRRIWGVDSASMPGVIDIDQLELKRQVHNTILIVNIRGEPQLGEVVFKTQTLDVKNMYRELRNLLTLPSHPNVQERPRYLVTKRVRFGGKRGVCGFVTDYHPLGSLDHIMAQYKYTLPISLRLRWAKDITSGLIAIRDSPLTFYPDLKLANIVIANETSGEEQKSVGIASGHAKIIDFEHGTPWMHWAPPEIYWVNCIQRLAVGNIDASVQAENSALLSSLVPGWTRRDRQTIYSGTESHNPAWDHLNDSETDSAVVYMLGKAIWCLMEGASNVMTPVTFASFLRDESVPLFPTFAFTPPILRECIRKCTSGAPEWDGKTQPFCIRKGNLCLRDQECTQNSSSLDDIKSAAKAWWLEQVEEAQMYIKARAKGVEDPVYAKYLDFMSIRPRLEDVLVAIESAERDLATM
jgi:hypothetical protein